MQQVSYIRESVCDSAAVIQWSSDPPFNCSPRILSPPSHLHWPSRTKWRACRVAKSTGLTSTMKHIFEGIVWYVHMIRCKSISSIHVRNRISRCESVYMRETTAAVVTQFACATTTSRIFVSGEITFCPWFLPYMHWIRRNGSVSWINLFPNDCSYDSLILCVQLLDSLRLCNKSVHFHPQLWGNACHILSCSWIGSYIKFEHGHHEGWVVYKTLFSISIQGCLVASIFRRIFTILHHFFMICLKTLFCFFETCLVAFALPDKVH